MGPPGRWQLAGPLDERVEVGAERRQASERSQVRQSARVEKRAPLPLSQARPSSSLGIQINFASRSCCKTNKTNCSRQLLSITTCLCAAQAQKRRCRGAQRPLLCACQFTWKSDDYRKRTNEAHPRATFFAARILPPTPCSAQANCGPARRALLEGELEKLN